MKHPNDRMDISKIEKVDIIKHFDNTVEKIVNHKNKWKINAITWLVIITVALIGSGYMNARAIGGLQVQTKTIAKEYVPDDLFLAIIHSFDLQNRYTLGLLNGQREEAEKAYQEFINFRDNIYQQHFKTRGSILPTKGLVVTKQ